MPQLTCTPSLTPCLIHIYNRDSYPILVREVRGADSNRWYNLKPTLPTRSSCTECCPYTRSRAAIMTGQPYSRLFVDEDTPRKLTNKVVVHGMLPFSAIARSKSELSLWITPLPAYKIGRSALLIMSAARATAFSCSAVSGLRDQSRKRQIDVISGLLD